MNQAWKILMALTFARLAMGFQFQSVPALAGPLTDEAGLSFAAFGTLTGAYLFPGVIVALLGGWMAVRVGDARTVMAGLALMCVGGAAGALAATFEVALFWRILAGIGAVALNVLVTKMVADWFEGKAQLPIAMGILVSSWPAGIALAALSLPLVQPVLGLQGTLLVPAGFAALALGAVVLFWRAPPRKDSAPQVDKQPYLAGRELFLVVLGGLIWALYNVSFVGIITWMPDLLQSQGVDSVAASVAASLIGWAAIVSVAAGGILAAKVMRKDTPALICFTATAAIIVLLPALGGAAGSVVVMIVLGLAMGPAAAMIMTLPVEAAPLQKRALAMGLYFAIYYGVMGLAPSMLGFLRDQTQSATAVIYTLALILVLCVVLWGVFRRSQRPASAVVE